MMLRVSRRTLVRNPMRVLREWWTNLGNLGAPAGHGPASVN